MFNLFLENLELIISLLVILGFIMIAVFIYSDIVSFFEEPLLNSLLIVMWLVVLFLLLRYSFINNYRITMLHHDKMIVIQLTEKEKVEFDKEFKVFHQL